ncbi:hypothetical protein [Lacticaseibacillus paracasei]|uniref:hypothetical protein n=1 Tax=Lacticaseibacillus paracasei TaxID=1597 RepID=UPI00192C095A|nr:hypothetical protein [Lacticaseibacillus paracasei]
MQKDICRTIKPEIINPKEVKSGTSSENFIVYALGSMTGCGETIEFFIPML